MRLPTWLRRRPTAPIRRPAARPRLTALEDRTAPATLANFLTIEHVDIDLVYSPGGDNGGWDIQPRDADANDGDGLSYQADDVLHYVSPEQSKEARPAAAAFDFLGVPVGGTFYRLPQSQDPNLLYLGIAGYGAAPTGQWDRYSPSAESGDRVRGNGPWLRVDLAAVRHTNPDGTPGDGKFSVWQSGDTGPAVFMSSADGITGGDGKAADALWIVAGGHIHYNWGFTAPGRYEVDLHVSGRKNDNSSATVGPVVKSAEPVTVFFSVGSVGRLGVDPASYKVDEAAGTATVTVTRTGGSDGRITARYATVAGTAKAGDDFTATSGTLVFADGQKSATVTVPIADDTAVEGDETFTVVLTDPGPGSIAGYAADIDGEPLIDPAAATATITVTDNDTPTNTPPTVSDIADVTTAEDTPAGPIAFTVGDAQTPAADLTVTAVSSNPSLLPAAGIAVGGSGAGRTLTLTPAADQSGSATVTVTVTDAGGLTATDTFVLTVGAVNDPPVARPDAVTTAEDTPVIVDVLANDSSPEGGAVLSVSAIGMAANGAVSVGSDGRTVTYAPRANFFGTDTFTYTVADEHGGVATATVTVTVTPVDDPAEVVPFALPVVVDGNLGGVSGLKAADLDGDGDQDLVAAGNGAGTVAWYANDGAGGFGPRRVVDASAADVWFVTPADVDGDGDTDILASAYSGTFAWYPNDGKGNFAPARVIADGVVTPWAAVVDFDGDATPDILAVPDFSDRVLFFRGLGGGNFAAPAVLADGLQNAIGLQAFDFDGDGDVDLAVGEYQTDRLLVYRNQGGGAVGAPAVVPAGDGAGVIASADLDGDGRTDLLALEFNANRVSWHANDGAGSFGPRRELPAALDGPYAVTTADLDRDGDLDVLIGTYSSRPDVVWLENLGGGRFGPAVTISKAAGQVGMLAAADFDADGDPDVALGSFSASQVWVFENKRGEFATQVVPPAAGTYLASYQVDVGIHFGFPVTVAGTPAIDLDIGGRTVTAEYVSGSGTPTLTFRYVVRPADRDLDGIAVTSAAVRLNGGAVVDPAGNAVDLTLPAADLSAVRVNGSAPFVTAVTRLDPTPTATDTVRFRVTFSQAVTGVDAADFAAAADGLSGAAVTGVAGAGAEYTVTVSTGTGSGTVGLGVPADATVAGLTGDPLGAGFAGGEVYTLHRRPARVIDTFYSKGHGDLAVGYADGAWDLGVHTDDLGEFAADGVVMVGGPEAQVARPAGAAFDFLGTAAGETVYVWPQGSSLEDVVPYLGIGAEEIAGGTFAAYANGDPRVAATGPWLKLQVTGVRAPAGGQFSIYNSTDSGPLVWVATADGLTAADAVFLLEGSHNHMNFAFTAPGVYAVDVVASGFRDANGNGTYDPGVDPYTESGVVTYYFQIDPPGGPTPVRLPADPLPPPVVVPFARAEPVLAGLQLPYTTAPADLDGDGDLDVLVAGSDGTRIVWVPNLGGGTFGPARTIDAGTPGGLLTNSQAVDFDRDGDLDVLAVGNNALRFYLNDGAGNFGPAVPVAATGVFRGAYVGDLDGDGDNDVAAVNNADGTALWYRNDGGGAFVEQVIGTGLAGARAMTALDADGDGDTDLVAGSNVVDQIALFVNDGRGGFGPAVVVTTDIKSIRNLYAADLDADGKTDIVSTDYGAAAAVSELAWYRNLGGNAFEKRVVAADLTGIFAAAVGDIDGDGDPDLVSGSALDSGGSVAWYANDGRGSFGPRQEIAYVQFAGILAVGLGDLNGDGRPDVVAGGSTPLLNETTWFENRLGGDARVVVPPADGVYIAGGALEFTYYVGYPVTVTGTPRLPVDVGGVTRFAEYVGGSGGPALTFRLAVGADDADLDGIALGSAVDLNGGSLTGPDGNPVPVDLPAVDLSGVRVNGSVPVVAAIERLDANPTFADTVRFKLTFSEAVTGLDAADLAVAAAGLDGAAVTGVSGGGAEYVVTVATGTGSGTVGVSVRDGATVADLAGNALAAGYAGGQVYTLNRRPARTIDQYWTEEHGDLGVGYEDGAWDLHVHTDADGEFAADGVLIVGGPDAKRATPQGPQWAFLGAGAESYWFPETGAIATVPDAGVSGEEIAVGTFARYFEADPRVNVAGSWVRLQLVGFRGPAGGQFSVYSSTDAGPLVWMATSDGISAADVLFVVPGSHAHYNFAFSKAGVYEVDVVASGFRDANGNGTYDPGIDPYTESGVVTYYFQIDPPGGPTPVRLPADPLPPTAVGLSAATVAENRAPGTLVGAVTGTDPNGDALTFSLVPGAADNARFTLAGGKLYTAQVFDFESNSTFTVRLRATDPGGLTVERDVTITVLDGNEAPTAVALSNATVAENLPAGTLVGTLSATDDATPSGGHQFFLFGGTAVPDNAKFRIVGNRLETAAPLDFEAQSEYRIRVRVWDGELSYIQDLTVTATDVADTLVGAPLLDVQRGAAQRSYVRFLDLRFGTAAEVATLVNNPGRVQLVRQGLDGKGTPVTVNLAGAVTAAGDKLSFDFGSNGLTQDGYYTLRLDVDGNGSFETERRFYRLLGDVNGDRVVDTQDVRVIQNGYPPAAYDKALDLTADNKVDAADRAAGMAARGRHLGLGLSVDD